ncbi:unnamed protein product [Rotaria socialis]
MIREPSHHTCIQSSSKKVVLEEAISRMKKRAGEETLPISQIYSQEIIKVPVNNPDMNTGTFFPMLDSIDSSLYHGWKLGSHGEPFLLVDEILHISGCFFHFSQSLWRKIQELGLTRYVKYSNLTASNTILTEEKRKGSQWFLCAIGLALIPVHLVEKTWAEVMDEHTPNHSSSIKFNGYIVSTYFDRTSCRYPVTLWNVNDALNSNIPRTNNHVEGYNSRLGSLFPVHPHIYKFIELLRDEHLFQHHHAE